MTMRFALAAALGTVLSLPCYSQSWRDMQTSATAGPLALNPASGGAANSKTVVLSGRVVTDDGSSLTEPAAIQSICDGRSRTVGYTDSKGYFNVDLNGLGQVPEASELGASGLVSNQARFVGQNCELQAELPGFVSERVDLCGKVAGLSMVDAGTLVLHSTAKAEGFTVSATSAAAPREAQKDFEKGREEEKKGRWAAARDKFLRAIERYPKYAIAWLELGRVQKHQGKLDDARQSFHEALAADAKLVTPYGELAEIAAKEKQWQEVANTTDQLLQLDPVSFPNYWFLNSAANYNLHKFDEAEKSVLRGLRLDARQRIPEMQYLLGVILAAKHDYRGAADHVRNYINLAPQAPDRELAQQQLQELEKLSGGPEK